MDPTPQELTGFTTLDQVGVWAGLGADELLIILSDLGNPVDFLQVASIPLEPYTETINLVRITGRPSADGNPGPQVPLTPVSKGKAQQFLRACVAKVATVSCPRPTGTPTTLAVRGPKMASFVDSSIDSEVIVLNKSHVEMLFSNYRTARGEFPSQDIEPTEEQLSAVHQLIISGAVPYADFAIFGPFGRRLLRKLTLMAYHYNAPEGTWKRVELPGPPDFESWWKSWLVLKCTLLLLGSVKPERLDLYGEHIRSFITTYGPTCWFLVYQADVRMRSEHFERIRRRLQIEFDVQNIQFGFDPLTPWDGVFAAATKDKEFWDSEIREKALLYLAKISTFRDASHDGTTQHVRGPAPPFQPFVPQGQKRKSQNDPRSKGGKNKGGQGRGGQSSFQGNGHESCNNWNAGICREPCPSGRSHTCSKCGGSHKRDQCSQSSSSKPQGKGGKNKGGKHKGEK
jgi:hypothetical protein